MYYKVVLPDLTSVSCIKNQFAGVQYKINEWVSPNIKNTKLFVFDDFDAACNYAMLGDKIYECEVENPSYEYELFINWVWFPEGFEPVINEDDLQKAKQKLGELLVDFNRHGPSHALCCDKIKLVRELKRSGEPVECV